MERRAAIEEAGVTRMRPILMTTLTTVLAMLQMVFSGDMASQLMSGMAIVIICGLTYATIMTLYAGEGKQGAALSAYNLAAGLTTFAGPGIATILLSTIGYGGVCWTYAALYVLAFILTLFIRPQQPGFDSHGHRIKKSADSVKEVAAEAKEDAPAVA